MFIVALHKCVPTVPLTLLELAACIYPRIFINVSKVKQGSKGVTDELPSGADEVLLCKAWALLLGHQKWQPEIRS